MAIYSGMLQALKGELLTALGSQEKVGGGEFNFCVSSAHRGGSRRAVGSLSVCRVPLLHV